MTLFYPDISGYQAGVAVTGVPIVMCKATEGTTYVNPDFANAQVRTKAAGGYFTAYHFLHAGNGAAQAKFCYSKVGKIPLMLDVEQTTGSNPGVADSLAFVKEFRTLGGSCYFLYFPKWWWSNLGTPSLASLAELGMWLVTSDYTSYSDSGPGWVGYGGMTPLVWQYTSTGTLNGVKNIDWNAFKGTLMDFEAYATTGAASGTNPTLSEGATGAAVITLQQRLNVWGAKLTVDGDFGPATLAAVKAFQTAHALTADGVVGPATWAFLNENPAPAFVAFPAPNALNAKSIDLHVSWNPVTIPTPDANAGQVATSYSVQAIGLNGAIYANETVTTNSAVISGLVPGWTYTIRVWANGSPVAPPHTDLKITV